MTTRFRTVVISAVVAAAVLMGSTSARAQDAQTCQPGILTQFQGVNSATYQALINALINGAPNAANLIAELAALVDQNTYAPLLADAQTIAGRITNGRVVVTLPDGTVVVDTGKGNNTFANFQAKAINENHNSRVAIFTAQEYPCGLALERKFSSTDQTVETYFALRAGVHLDSYGTIRISTK